ncbi:hypothetical protein LAV77_04970 [Priestia megaterium]|uniref:RNA dependent RNA polymerase n=1 Tax=Priestia megaterium TaxID=1404 RepID=UPI002B249749|nr:hypothetical protein [Priestia megaterium]MEB2264146.1 hypothetical protein [Priestia megaterium]
MTNLTNQIHLYQLGTEAFYNNEEWAIHTNKMEAHKKLKELKKQLAQSKSKINKLREDGKNVEAKLLLELCKEIRKEKQVITKGIESYGEQLKKLLINNKGSYRKLRKDDVLKDSNVVSMFESVLSRAIGAETNKLTTDIIIVECFYEEVLEDILVQGFEWSSEHWILFSASAGQTRQKRCVMIKKSKWDKVEKELMCGLTVDDINAKGSMNISKLLAYKALANSATTLWEDFNIDECIVVDDMEVVIHGEVDHINTETYEIERKKNHPVKIEVTDGCGMILPELSDKNFMFRAPFFKGLLASFDFRNEKFMTDGKLIVKDIYNKEHDLIAEGIKIIFTKSQFKLHSMYDSWEEYKVKFVENFCTAGKLNEEEDVEEQDNKRLNYQMLQSLHSMTNNELRTIASETIKEISLIGKDTDVMMNILGANDPKTPLQHALAIYPELLQDAYTYQQIKEKKKYLVKDARAGKLKIESSYTFVIPDLYAFCNWLFKGNQEGLLNDGEVFCKQYGNQELNLLRSPHLYIEHCIRQNVIDEKKSKWFTTNGIYTSAQDLYSKLIMCDWDGDKLLICADPTVINAAKRQIEQDNVVPLYYEMAKAKPAKITNQSICDTLMIAYQANIGLISNLISKIWNSEKPDIELIKLLVMESNHEIDFAKTLYKPTRPPHIDEKIKQYENERLPYFFKYAKNKKRVMAKNNSVVNRLSDIIQNKRIHFEELDMKKFDAKFLIADTSNRIDSKLAQQVIEKYNQLNKDKFKSIKKSKDIIENRQIPAYVNKQIREELIKVGKSATYVTDILIKYLYWNENAYKSTLWNCFGYEIVNNLRKTKQCLDCEGRYKPTKQRQVRCDKCQTKHAKELAKERKRKQREKEKMSR